MAPIIYPVAITVDSSTLRGTGDPVSPRPGFGWTMAAFAAACPPGTDGALLFYRGGALIRVEDVGEFSSLEWAQPFPITSEAPLTIAALNIQGGQVNITLQINEV